MNLSQQEMKEEDLDVEKDEEIDEDDDDDDDDDDEDDDEEDEPEFTKIKGKRKRKENKRGGKKRGIRASIANIFNEEADVADDSEEEDGDGEEYFKSGEAAVLEQDVLDARKKVEARHEKNREFQKRSADDIANEYEERFRQDERIQKGIKTFGASTTDVSSVAAVQSLLPSISDPAVFRVKCVPGMEQQLVLSLLRKSVDTKNKGGLLRIKSAFCTGSKGYVYIESISETFVKESMIGLRGFYYGTLQKVYVQEMTALLNVKVARKPLTVGQWVRLKRGPQKGDLARVVQLTDGGTRAFIQLVPRIDYNAVATASKGTGEKKRPESNSLSMKPPQRLFDPEEAAKSSASHRRAYHPKLSMKSMFDLFNNEYYKDGFLYKEVGVLTFLNENNVKPTLEELQLFNAKKVNNEDELDNNINDSDLTDRGIELGGGASFVKELAEQIKTLDEEDKTTVIPYIAGDLVQVTSGELRNLIGKVTTVSETSRTLKIFPYNNEMVDGVELEVEVDIVTRYIIPGAHVKVVAGRYLGQTGRVVSVSVLEGANVAAVLTDGMNTEIQCNVGHLQMTNEVSVGPGSLMGFEIYDLVMLNENETAVITKVGAEKLTVINNNGDSKDVYPMDINSKRNSQSLRSTTFDAHQSMISVNDTVNVTAGPHSRLKGTVKHIMKGTIWLHSNMYLKNSGIFVAKGRQCLLAGSDTVITSNLAAAYSVITSKSLTASGKQNPAVIQSSQSNNAGGRRGKDPDIGKTVRITKGGFKGLLAQIVDTTPTHYSVELLAKLRKIVIEKDKTSIVGDKKGALEQQMDLNPSMSFATPALTAATPHTGDRTPGYSGSETPGTPFDWDRKSYNDEDSFSSGYGSRQHSYHDSNNFALTSLDKDILQQSTLNDKIINTNYTPSTQAESSLSSWNHNFSPFSQSTTVPSATPLKSNPILNPDSSKFLTNLVVIIVNHNQFSGKLAVIQQRPDENGNVTISLRDSSGHVERSTISIHFSDLKFPAPPKNEKVYVFEGSNKGLTGICKASMKSDVVIEINEKMVTVKTSSVGWLNTER